MRAREPARHAAHEQGPAEKLGARREAAEMVKYIVGRRRAHAAAAPVRRMAGRSDFQFHAFRPEWVVIEGGIDGQGMDPGGVMGQFRRRLGGLERWREEPQYREAPGAEGGEERLDRRHVRRHEIGAVEDHEDSLAGHLLAQVGRRVGWQLHARPGEDEVLARQRLIAFPANFDAGEEIRLRPGELEQPLGGEPADPLKRH